MPRGRPSPKISVTLDPDVHELLVETAAADGVSVSAWVTEALRKELMIRDGLAAVAEFEREHGAFTDEEMDAARERVFEMIRSTSRHPST